MRPFLEEFFKRTSLHGFERLTQSNTYRVLRLLWVIFILCSMGCLIYRLNDLHTEYLKYNTKSKYSIRTHSKLPFPAVTLCNLSPYLNKSVTVTSALQNFLLAATSFVKHYSRPINWNEIAYIDLDAEDLWTWHDNASPKLEDMFILCKMNNRLLNCSDHFTITETEIGRCFTFNRDNSFASYLPGNKKGLRVVVDIMQENNILSSDDVSAGLKVFVHSPEEEPDVYNDGTIISPGTESYIRVQKMKFFFKPYPYKYNEEDYCLDTEAEDYVNTLHHYKVYSPIVCIHECISAPIAKKCGCVPPTLSERWNITTCNRRKLLECFVTSQQTSIDDVNTEAGLVNLQEKCGCKTPCVQSQYSTSASSAISPSAAAADILANRSFLPSLEYGRLNLLYLHVFYDKLITSETIYEPEYTTEGVLVSIGGYLGLFIGASFLSVLEVAEFLCTSLLQCLKRKHSTSKISACDVKESESGNDVL